MVYEAANAAVIARIPRTTKRLLDVGCGTGALGHELKKEIDCEVVGITSSAAEAVQARDRLDHVVVADLNAFDSNGMEPFDCIVCSHVLEHLFEPEKLLEKLRPLLTSKGTLLVALPNVLFWQQRWKFLRGRFRYEDGGIMDRTHYRFFDWESAQELLRRSRYMVVAAAADGSFPLSRFFPGAGTWLDRTSLKRFPGLFGFQFIFECQAGAASEAKP